MSKRILVVGQSPLPPELAFSVDSAKGQRMGAPGVRAWHFGRALSEAGNEVVIAGVGASSTERRSLGPGLTFWPLSELAVTHQDGLARLAGEFKPDAVVGASVWPSYLAALYLPADLPFWADLFGSPLAEGQAKAVVTGDDGVIEPFATFEATVLRRADLVSVVCEPQAYATVGALATHGRLNRATDGYNFTRVMEASLDPQILPPTATPVMRGSLVPQDAFVVLWSGGFNTWADVDTLFTGLERALALSPRLHFVVTGGALGGHDNRTYPHFQSLVAASPYRDRFHLLGWLPYEGLHNYYLESDLGIVTDRWSYEGVLGSRTRLLDWLLYGLPAAATTTAPLVQQLATENLVFPLPPRDPAAITSLLLELANDSTWLKNARAVASSYAITHFAYSKVYRPLVEWADAPFQAPDAGQPPLRFNLTSDSALERQLADLRAQLEAKNEQIAALEGWAADMQNQLKTRPTNWLSRVRRKLKS